MAREHRAPVVRADLGAEEARASVVEHVERRVVRVRPDAELRIIGEVRVLERVAIVRAHRVAARRDGDALQVRSRADRELADDPAVRELVVLDRRVTVVVRFAAAAEPGEEGVRRRRAVERSPGLVEHGEALVDDLDERVRPHCAVGIGRCGGDRVGTGRAGEACPDAFEAETERGRRGGTRARLDDWIARTLRGHRRPLLRLLLLLLLVGLQSGRRDTAQGRGDVVVDVRRRIVGVLRRIHLMAVRAGGAAGGREAEQRKTGENAAKDPSNTHCFAPSC